MLIKVNDNGKNIHPGMEQTIKDTAYIANFKPNGGHNPPFKAGSLNKYNINNNYFPKTHLIQSLIYRVGDMYFSIKNYFNGAKDTSKKQKGVILCLFLKYFNGKRITRNRQT